MHRDTSGIQAVPYLMRESFGASRGGSRDLGRVVGARLRAEMLGRLIKEARNRKAPIDEAIVISGVASRRGMYSHVVRDGFALRLSLSELRASGAAGDHFGRVCVLE